MDLYANQRRQILHSKTTIEFRWGSIVQLKYP